MIPSKAWNAKLEAALFLPSKNLYKQCAYPDHINFSCTPFSSVTKNIPNLDYLSGKFFWRNDE